MKIVAFTNVVAHLVSKVADRRPLEIDPDFSPEDYFDSGADDSDNQAYAFRAAADLLSEAGYLDPVDAESELAERVCLKEAIERVLA
jgi:hypothetical protein